MRQLVFVIVSLSIVLTVSLGLAQDAQRYAPKQPPEEQTPPRLPTLQRQPQTSSDQVLQDQLKGLRFVDDFNKFDETGSDLPGVSFDGTLLNEPAFVQSMQARLGKPLTMNVLNAITSQVVDYYRRHDRPVVDAIVPKQDVTAGVVQVVVLEGKVGDVQVEGNRYFSAQRIAGAIRAKSGDTISQRALLGDLDWANNNPFRRVDLIFQRGANLGDTDLLLHVQDRYPLRPYLGYENTGTDTTGQDRLFAGLNWGDAFGLDHRLDYQFTSAPDHNDFTSHWLSYAMPLPWRHTLTFFGNYTETQSRLAGLFDLGGRSWQLSARYEIPLAPQGPLHQSLLLGFDFKQSNNNLEFGGTQVFANDTDIAQWSLGYRGEAKDDFGLTRGSVTLVFSPGDVTDNNTDTAFDAARSGAEASYAYLHAQLERNTNLPWQFTLANRLEAQWAGDQLLGSEQIGFGGMYSIRGYDERIVNGDDGIILCNDLLTPPLRVAELIGFDVPDELRFLAFYDFGYAHSRGGELGSDHAATFSSLGLGLRYQLAPYISLRYDYGWRLHEVGDNDTSGGRHHLSVVASWSF